jgi:hydroxybutyrate-dimer hydrolase
MDGRRSSSGARDALLPPNHTSRAYFGLNKTVEQGNSRLSYIEVVNGNHFDAFIPIWAPTGWCPCILFERR